MYNNTYLKSQSKTRGTQSRFFSPSECAPVVFRYCARVTHAQKRSSSSHRRVDTLPHNTAVQQDHFVLERGRKFWCCTIIRRHIILALSLSLLQQNLIIILWICPFSMTVNCRNIATSRKKEENERKRRLEWKGLKTLLASFCSYKRKIGVEQKKTCVWARWIMEVIYDITCSLMFLLRRRRTNKYNNNNKVE